MSPGVKEDSEITGILKRLKAGDSGAASELVPMVYRELKRIATAHLRREQHAESIQPTALVNEAYMRLLLGQATDWKDRVHFYAVAAQTMRHILVDRARARLTRKRGGELRRVELSDAFHYVESRSDEVLELNDALDRLAVASPRASKVVEMRYFAGMTDEEIAESLGTSSRTVRRDWRIARAWLRNELDP